MKRNPFTFFDIFPDFRIFIIFFLSFIHYNMIKGSNGIIDACLHAVRGIS
ncbi:hypothetical protein ROSEINA2194_00730 [Roseburia inulinivorans DSM 16841]|uniref:Uncharacterized protein n=1 Tax=Roseburia inulinivorans DSM 16841 TaxID=622312 RepID=C0FPS7_9FIRM|nr:hypothetical protein ROSEINA2194_00730 [Roseburia inulinivorans DSM 16841]